MHIVWINKNSNKLNEIQPKKTEAEVDVLVQNIIKRWEEEDRLKVKRLNRKKS